MDFYKELTRLTSMDFYDEYEQDLSDSFVSTDYDTSDMPINENENTEFFITCMSEFKSKNNLSIEGLQLFHININQKVIWENILQDQTPFSRKTFNMDKFIDYMGYTVPDYYLITHKNNSIVSSGIKYFLRYLYDKYSNFDFRVMNDKIERMQEFSVFNYLYKTFYMFETLLPIAINNSKQEYFLMFEDLPEHKKYEKIKDKSYVGLIWNTVLSSYLSKCDEDLFDIFDNQTWDFVSAYVLKNI